MLLLIEMHEPFLPLNIVTTPFDAFGRLIDIARAGKNRLISQCFLPAIDEAAWLTALFTWISHLKALQKKYYMTQIIGTEYRERIHYATASLERVNHSVPLSRLRFCMLAMSLRAPDLVSLKFHQGLLVELLVPHRALSTFFL